MKKAIKETLITVGYVAGLFLTMFGISIAENIKLSFLFCCLGLFMLTAVVSVTVQYFNRKHNVINTSRCYVLVDADNKEITRIVKEQSDFDIVLESIKGDK